MERVPQMERAGGKDAPAVGMQTYLTLFLIFVCLSVCWLARSRVISQACRLADFTFLNRV